MWGYCAGRGVRQNGGFGIHLLIALVLFTGTLRAQNCVAPPDGLIGWWPGNGNADDLLDGHPGTITTQFPGQVLFSAGKVGTAFDFRGANFVEIPTIPLNSFTLEFWLNQRTRNTDNNIGSILVSAEVCGVVDDWGVSLLPDGRLRVQVGDATQPGTSYSSFPTSLSSIPLNAFTHVAVTRNTNTSEIKIYINGVLDSTHVSPHNRVLGAMDPTCDGDLHQNRIGIGNLRRQAILNGNSSAFDGLIDEVSLYNRALSVGEIVAIYNAGSGGKCPPASEPQCVQVPAGLVSWWPAEGDANDIVSTNNGTLMNGAAFTNGIVGQAFSFDGADDFVSFGSTAGNFGTNDFTVEFWIKTRSTRVESVVEKWPVCTWASLWYIRLGGGTVNAEIHQDSSGTNGMVLNSTKPVNDGLFHHVALVRRGTTGAFYIDGVLNATALAPGILNVSNSVNMVAGRSVCVGVDGTSPFTGQMDELAIYHRALSDSEIQGIYNAGGAGKCPPGRPNCVSAPPGLISWWPAEEDAQDSVSTNNGTLMNGATFANGIVGQAFSFDGADDFVSFGNTAGNFGTNDFTVEFWIKTRSTRVESVVEKWPVCTWASLWYIRLGAGTVNAEIHQDSSGTNGMVLNSTKPVNDGLFHHVALVRRGTTGAFYIDGVLNATALAPGILNVSNSVNMVAGRSVCVGVDGTSPFTGQLDELAIYNRALSDSEIQGIYNAGGAGKCPPGRPNCISAPPSLISWWPAEGDAQDSVSSNNGTLMNGATFANGIVGQAFSFDGADDFVSFGNTAGNFGTNDFTVEFWIKTRSTRVESVVEKWPVCTWASLWYIRLGAGTVNAEIHQDSSGTNGMVLNSTIPVNDGLFHHVALVRRGTTGAFYIDGVLNATALAPGILNVSNSVNMVAGRSVCVGVDGTSPFTGQLDELAIYNRALSDSEIQGIYNAGGAGKCAPPPLPARALAHWRFDEPDGSIAHDSAGSYNGTLSSRGASFVSGGVSGGALRLSKANNGFVTMGDMLGLENTDFSIIAWIKMSPGDTSDALILTKHAAYSRNGYLLVANKSGAILRDDKAAFIEGGSGVAAHTLDETPVSTTSVNDGNWHQIVAVYQPGGVKSIYVDGAPAEDSKPSQPFLQNSVAFLIGGVNNNGVPGGAFNGLIDEVQIYNYALSASQVDFLFTHPSEVIPNGELPVGWTLNTAVVGGGTIQRNPDLARYPSGTNVTLTAVTDAGFAFVGWSGDASGTNNPIPLVMDGNKSVTANFREIPARVLAVVSPEPRQEGSMIDVPITLTSQGEVGGMSFVLHFNPTYLRDPDLEWSSVLGSALLQVGYERPGEIRATFALPATAVPAGTLTLANISFRTRSVPFSLSTDLGLQIIDASKPTGDPITSGSYARSGSAQILVRRVIGDNNANDRLDIGDASIIERLLTGLDPVRSWDVTGNDLNANTRPDSGDVIRVLRVVVGLDPQPQLQSGAATGSERLAKSGLQKSGPVSGQVALSLDKLSAQPGQLVALQVRLHGLATSLEGATATLEYPTNALRLLNSQSQRTGLLVPAGALTVWNVAPAQTNYASQSGRVLVAMSSPVAWSTNEGVLAEFVFQVQAGQTAQYQWPIRVSNVEVTASGYDVQSLADTETFYIGRVPILPNLSSTLGGLLSNGFSLSLAGESRVLYRIEVSSDLAIWSPLVTLITGSNGALSFVDSAATNSSQRFYRARQQ